MPNGKEELTSKIKALKDATLSVKEELQRELFYANKAVCSGIHTASTENLISQIDACDEILESIKAIYKIAGVFK